MSKSYIITDAQIRRLKMLAESWCADDNEDYNPADSGNYDDTFRAGCNSGRVNLARELLEQLGIEYKKSELYEG